ncbi:MAG: translation initiation factor IF-3 [Dehalococcoidia bacterium]|nr:translation initiation factor IF-3 [Dehalococcoidia bacterium]
MRPVPRNPEPYRVNGLIRGVQEVRLIDDKDENVGVVLFTDALRMARERELDLVEVAAQAKPPVCRILDYGRFKYEQEKKSRQARKAGQASKAAQEMKEVQLSPRIEEHDLQMKVKRALKFLRAGHPVRMVVRFFGRDARYLSHTQVGFDIIHRAIEALGPDVKLDRPPRLESRQLEAILRVAKSGTSSPDSEKAAEPTAVTA